MSMRSKKKEIQSEGKGLNDWQWKIVAYKKFKFWCNVYFASACHWYTKSSLCYGLIF